MDSVFLFIVMMMWFGLIAALIYKHRFDIKLWLKDPKRGSTWRPSRETYLRRRIEDAKMELDWLRDNNAETGE